MCVYLKLYRLVGIVFIIYVNCEELLEYSNSLGNDGFMNYSGEYFPSKYLSLDNTKSSVSDLQTYIHSLSRIVRCISRQVNSTDTNLALGMFFAKSILKRTIRENSEKLEKISSLKQNLMKIINGADNIVSHYKFRTIYSDDYKVFSDSYRQRLYKIFQFDEPVVHAMRKFSSGKLVKWIHSTKNLHLYVEQFDKATYPRIEFIKLIMKMNDLYPIAFSDDCISNIVYDPEPIHLDEIKPCRPDPKCKNAAMATPSFAYIISHRLMVLLTRQIMKRCYLLSSLETENVYIDLLCANMYREVVYLARRGFFSRDLFLEHISLCALFGYEEFYRRPWFIKAASWVDKDGCVREDRNNDINQSNIRINLETDLEEKNKLRKLRWTQLNSDCHIHPMALMTFTLAHGIRHALFYLTDSVLNTIKW